MRIYADVERRQFTFDSELALAYQAKTDRNVTILHLAKVRREDVPPPVVIDRGRLAYVILTEAQHDSIMTISARATKWAKLQGDLRPFEDHRLSLDGTKGLFRVRIKEGYEDDLNQFVSGGHIEAWYEYFHQEFDENGNPTDTTIKDFLSGNPDWESPDQP